MVRLQYLAGGLILLTIWFSPGVVRAEEGGPDSVTLINGAVVRGTVTAVSSTGVVINIGNNERSFPWVAVAPGSRFRYDTQYRANFREYLEGADISALTNQPDPAYDPMNPVAVEEQPEEPEVAASTSLAGLVWSGHASLVPAKTRGMETVAAGKALFWAVRLGTGPDDLLVVAYEGGAAPKLQVMRPGDGWMTKEVSTSMSDGSPPWLSTSEVYPVSFGSMSGEVGVSWMIGREGPDAGIGVELACSVNHPDGPLRFTLRGEAVGWVGPKEALAPHVPYSAPEMDLFVQYGGNEAHLVGGVRMGRWMVYPGEGLASSVRMDVQDDQGKQLLREDMSLTKSDDPGAWPLKLALPGIGPGVNCTARADINWGDWLGRASTEYRFAMPDPFKL